MKSQTEITLAEVPEIARFRELRSPAERNGEPGKQRLTGLIDRLRLFRTATTA